MERLKRLINILKLTPHRQPELVKEAASRILGRSIKVDPQLSFLLKPVLEILIQYCDTDDSAERSLFNDYLNSVILAFQNQHYHLILQVLLEELTNNGSARSITVALLRLPGLVNNIQPIELGCDSQKLLKALIEIARRSDDESVQKALEATLRSVMPYLDHDVRKSKEMQFLINSLVEVLFRNLQHESSQIKRVASSIVSVICANSETQLENTLNKLKNQLDNLTQAPDASLPQCQTNKFVGFCMCVKELPVFADKHHDAIISVLLSCIKADCSNVVVVIASLELMRYILLQNQLDKESVFRIAQQLTDNFLICTREGAKTIRDDVKVILQTNALSCLSTIIKQQPKVLDSLGDVLQFKKHQDIAVQNQVIQMIGNYIASAWQFPRCLEYSVDCGKIRKLWVELRTILSSDSIHPDSLKSCVASIKTCVNILLESDHCLHIIEYQDFDRLIHLYSSLNFKPFKIEVLDLFANLNYRTLNYLERHHWSKLRAKSASYVLESLQDRVIHRVLIPSITDEHQRIRNSATFALITIIPNLYITSMNNQQRPSFQRPTDPIVAFANDLVEKHLVVLEQADEHMFLLNDPNDSMINPTPHNMTFMESRHKILDSSMIPEQDGQASQCDESSCLPNKNVCINLSHIVQLLKARLEESLNKGKTSISSIVRTFHDLSLAYPISRYSASWDCRPSEYCDCFTVLNFLLAYLENLTEPDVVVEDLESYRIFLNFAQQLLYALCHESVSTDYELQRIKPHHVRVTNTREGDWSNLKIKHSCIANIYQVYFTHSIKLLWLLSYVIEGKSNPFSAGAYRSQQQLLQKASDHTDPADAKSVNFETLTSNRLLFGRVHKKLEQSYKSSKKNLNQQEGKFYQILESCLNNISSLLEFMSMSKSIEHVRDIIGYLKITGPICCIPSIKCARQLLKSLFGINTIAIYQVDPHDWFQEDSIPLEMQNQNSTSADDECSAFQGVYYQLISSPYQKLSNYHSMNCSQITPISDKTLAILNLDVRQALKIKRRIEERVRSLFEFDPHQMISPKVRQISETLKSTIAEFSPIVTDCMSQFNSKGFCGYQVEVLHFMIYLLLLRVNFQKLPLANDFIESITRLLDNCGDRMFRTRETGIELLLRSCFTFLNALTYERGPSKPQYRVADLIQILDDLRAKLSLAGATDEDTRTYIVPLLRCLVEDLFIYRTKHFHNVPVVNTKASLDLYDELEVEREIVTHKLLVIIDNPGVYNMLSILIAESRQNSSEIKYKKLSQHLLSIIPNLLSRRNVNMSDFKRITITRIIIENISPEVFQPLNFILETLLDAPKPALDNAPNGWKSRQDFQRWMSLVIITIHILITQVKETKFLARIRETTSDEMFVKYLLQIAQLCLAELFVQLSATVPADSDHSTTALLTQQLSSYLLYLTNMFQSGLYFELSKSAASLIKKEIKADYKGPKRMSKLIHWARDPNNDFSLAACEKLFFQIRLINPDLTILWCNLMMLLDYVDCNRDYWRNLLIYECNQCLVSKTMSASKPPLFQLNDTSIRVETTPIEDKPAIDGGEFKRSNPVSRPTSLNLSNISFNDQLRRSFIKKIADSESSDRVLNRNVIETNGEDGQVFQLEAKVGNIEQCLAPSIELTRRGTLCLALDFVCISMSDVEQITWLIIHHINDIIRWSHETPVKEFVTAVHRNSASSGIFIQAISSNFNNLTSIAIIHRLLWTLEQVHYTRYGSLVILLVEKLLSAPELLPYISLTKRIEEFACDTVDKLINETNKNLFATKDEVINQLTTEDLDKISSMLDVDLYPRLLQLLSELRSQIKV